MLGLTETEEEVTQTLKDLKSVGVDIVTMGQYLRPTMKHLPVHEYVSPEKFQRYESTAKKLGFDFVAAGPLVRSSYKAGELYVEGRLRNNPTRTL